MRTSAHRFVLIVCTLCVTSLATTGWAAEDEDWHFKTYGGIWLMALNGTVGFRDLKSDVDADFGDVIDKTNISINPNFELSKGDWTVMLNGTFSKLEDSHTLADGRGADIDVTQAFADLWLGYNLIKTKFGDNPFTLMPMVGARVTYMKLEIDPKNFGSADRDKTWVDPMVGARAVLGLTPDLDWRTELAIGGFGVSSDLTWSAGTFIDWEFAKGWSLNFGYRAINWDYDNDDFIWDMTQHGPWIGLSHQWF